MRFLPSRTRFVHRRTRRGFSLLEVILSLAIFTLGLVAIGELMRLGLRNATIARDGTRAQIIAESLLNELASQSREVTPVADQASEVDPEFQFSIQVAPVDLTGLLSVTVFVRRANSTNVNDGFSVTRWITDPQYVAQMEADAEAQAAEQSTTTTSSTSSPAPQ